MSEKKLRVAIAGAGRMASSIDDEIRAQDTWLSLKRQLPYSHAPCYKQFPDLELVAVCDPVEAKCRAFCARWETPRFYLDYRDMIETECPDILSITTPATAHAEIALFAMKRGVRGIYCEKAMCCSLAEADALVASVARHGTKFMLGAQRRHHPNFRRARELVESGEVGELIAVTTWIEGALLHSLSHLADNGLFLAGDAAPVSVFGILSGLRTGGSLDAVEARRVAADARYDPESRRWSGDPGCSTYTAQLENGVYLLHLPAFMDVRFEITGTNGYLRIVDNNDTLHLFKRHGHTYTFDRVDLPSLPPASSHLALVQNLVDCVKMGGQPLANETVARNGMELLMGVAASHLQGGATVRLPLGDRDMYIPSH